MAKLGNLWFDLGLDTTTLDKAWSKAMKEYQSKAKIDLKIGFADLDRAKEQFKALQQQERMANTTRAMSEKQALNNTIQREIGTHKVALAEQKVNTERLRGQAISDKALASINSTSGSFFLPTSIIPTLGSTPTIF